MLKSFALFPLLSKYKINAEKVIKVTMKQIRKKSVVLNINP